MALKKTINFKGYTPEYWAIVAATYDIINAKTRVILSLFKDEQTRRDDPKAAISNSEFLIEGIDRPRADLYAAIRQQNPEGADKEAPIFFADAEDC